ncbi:MAG: glycosyltransferase [Deltaproteobacteria bacterium]|nr:glycosyltransferase [Deltaproteobacteria bacterium]
MTIWVLTAASLLLLCHLAMAWGVVRLSRRRPPPADPPPSRPRPSVVVVVKDEEPSLPRLLASLAAQRSQDFELVFVDDGSTDGTRAILDAFVAEAPDRRQVLAGQEDRPGLTPKQQRLDEGVATARGEVILFTDGDCVVPPRWVEETVGRFADAEVGVVFGQLSVHTKGGWLQDQQAFDLPLLQAFAAGSAGFGAATGGCGNNQAVRRSTLEAVGGFAGLGYTLTEDTALVGAARQGGWKVDVTVTDQTRTETSPRTTWRSLYHQRLRWMGGLWCASDWVTRWAVRGYALCAIAGTLALPLTAVLGAWELTLWPAALILGVIAVAAAGADGRHRGSARWLLWTAPRAAAFVISQALLACLMVPGGPAPVWKGRRLVLRGTLPSQPWLTRKAEKQHR